MEKKWVQDFIIKGMIRRGKGNNIAQFPEKIMSIDEKMALSYKKEDCLAHLLLSENGDRPESYAHQIAFNRVFNFICLYTLFSEKQITMQTSGSYPIEDLKKLGHGPALYGTVSIELLLTLEDTKREEQRVRDYLHKSIKYLKICEQKFQKNLKNALHYFYYAINSERYEDKMINFIIALESLYIEDPGELKYRLSNRVATLIAHTYTDRSTAKIYTDIKNFYKERCDIVHGKGSKFPSLSFEDKKVRYERHNKLQNYVKRSINIFFLLLQRKSKKNILKLIDKAVTDRKEKKKLIDIISMIKLE